MNGNRKNAAAILAYFSWIGWIIALFTRDPRDRFATHHMNQALVLQIAYTVASFLRIIPILGSIAYSIVGGVTFVMWCIGLYRAFTWNDTPLPFVGEIQLIH